MVVVVSLWEKDLNNVELLSQYIDGLKQTLDQLPLDTIDHMVRLLHNARLQGKQVFCHRERR